MSTWEEDKLDENLAAINRCKEILYTSDDSETRIKATIEKSRLEIKNRKLQKDVDDFAPIGYFFEDDD